MKNKENTPPDWKVVIIDETSYWNGTKVQERGGSIFMKYFFDASTYTYLCSSTPNYYLIVWCIDFFVEEGITEEERDEMEEELMGAVDYRNDYMTVSSIKKFGKLDPTTLREGVLDLDLDPIDFEDEQDVLEYLCANHPC